MNDLVIEKKKSMINSITGIKVIALLFLFMWHSALPRFPLELGSRMCELLFVISGFLVGYNKIEKNIPCNYKSSFNYVITKLIQVFPLHCIITFLRCISEYKIFTSYTAFIKLFLSLFLLQGWSPYEEVYFAFNGSSWFLGALLFCYFMSPLLLRIIKTNRTVLLFFITLFIRLFIDIITEHTSFNYLPIDTHVNPIVRCLEFFLGMLMVPQYFKISNKLNYLSTKKNTIVFSVIEFVILFFTVFFMYYLRNVMPKTFFVLLFCILTLIFSFDRGILSRFFSMKLFKSFNKIQFEFYLSHTTFFRYCKALLAVLDVSKGGATTSIQLSMVLFIIEFILLTAICILYNKTLKKKFTVLMNSLTIKFYTYFNIQLT